MKKILIICYYWPPSAGSGVQRWLKFTKYLHDFGWFPIVYTPENPDFDLQDLSLLKDIPDQCEVIKNKIWEPYRIAKLLSRDKKINVGVVGDGNKQKKSLTKKMMNWIRGNFFIPDPRVFWVRPSVRFLKRYIDRNDIECIVTTGPPHSMHLIGLKLKRKLNIKWISDFRDPWSKLDFLDTFYVSMKNRRKYEQMEKKVLTECDAVIGTSPSMKLQLQPFDHKKFHSVTNGFDQDDFQNTLKRGDQENIIIYHAGLLNKMRNPIHLWEALDKLCRNNSEIDKKLKIHLVGVIDSNVIQAISAYDHLENKLIIEGYKQHEEVLKDYQKATFLLLLINNTNNAQVNIPGKLFEYIASGKKIICIGEKNADASRIVQNENLGKVYSYIEKINTEELAKFLIAKQDSKSYQIIEKYSRKALTSQLVKIIESL